MFTVRISIERALPSRNEALDFVSSVSDTLMKSYPDAELNINIEPDQSGQGEQHAD